ncbi:hypothetical protein C8R46DRAFT_1255822 [Mycena filopes]|nr:hypothetical protein C8R46DRAFT_1255822 [Mycena filopes]
MAMLNVTIDDASPLIRYDGNWTQTSDPSKQAFGYGYTETYHPNASAVVHFQGTRITVNGARSNYTGNYTITLDGQEYHYNGYSSKFVSFENALFSREDLEPGPHDLFIVNDGGNSLDIDSITWSCGIGGQNDTGKALKSEPVDDTDSTWTWAKGWDKSPLNITMFNEQTGHSTSHEGASVNYTFYATPVRRPDQPTPAEFSSRRSMFSSQVVLYFGEGFGPGNHTITLMNEAPGLFQIDYAVVHRLTVNSPNTSDIPPDPNLSTHKRLSAGVIVAITFTALLFVLLILAVVFLLQRNKTLWFRLQRGYSVQSQFDVGSLPNGTITPMPYTPPQPRPGRTKEYFQADADDDFEAQRINRATTMESHLTASTLVADAGSFMSRYRPFSLKALRLSSRFGSSPASSQTHLSQQQSAPSLRRLTLSTRHNISRPPSSTRDRHNSLSPSTPRRSPSARHLLRQNSDDWEYYQEESHYYDPYTAAAVVGSGLEEVPEEQVDDLLRHPIRRNEPSMHRPWQTSLP